MHRHPLPIVLGLILLGLSGLLESPAAQDIRLERGSPRSGVVGGPAFTTRIWGIGDGLPQSSITQLGVDAEGFVWGTTYGGLFRFDGRNFVTHVPSRADGASGLSLTGMVPASAGGFWIVNSRGAVSRIDDSGQVVEEIPLPDGLPQADFPVSLHEDSGSNIWLLGWGEARGWGGEIWRLDPRRVERSWPATRIVEDGAGNLTVSAVDGFVNLGENSVLPPPWNQIEDIPRSASTSMDTAGRIWLGGRDFLYVYDQSRLVPISGVRGYLLGAHPRRDGSMWIVTLAGVWLASGPGLDRPGPLQDATLELEPVELPTGVEILSATVTPDDVLILGLLGQGLISVAPSPGLLVDTRPYLLGPDTLSRTIHSLMPDGQGGLWLSRDCGDVARLEGSALRSIRSTGVMLERSRALPDVCARSLHLTAGGSLLAGIPDGILRIDQDADTARRIAIPESDGPDPGSPMARPAPVSYLDLGPDSILMGMNDGRLMLMTPGEDVLPWPRWTPVDGAVRALAKTSDGVIWIGAIGDLWALHPDGTLQAEQPVQGAVSREPIRVLIPDQTGGLWIGRYGGGLSYRAPDGRFTSVPLPDQTLSSILFSDDGSLWLAQNSGLYVLRPDVVEAVRQGLDRSAPVRSGRDSRGQ